MALDDTIDYQAEIDYFHRLRDANIRYEASDIGGRAFVLVPNVTDALLQPCPTFEDKLTRLLWAAYGQIDGQAPQVKATQLHGHLPVFYALLDLDLGHRIHEFLDDNLKDLPIPKHKLEKFLDPVIMDIFFDQQWRWCPMVFRWRMYGRLEYKEYIVPIVARTKIEPSRDGLPKSDRKAALWIVEVPTELVEEPIKEKLRPVSDNTHQTNQQQISVCFSAFPVNTPTYCSVALSIRG